MATVFSLSYVLLYDVAWSIELCFEGPKEMFFAQEIQY